MLDIERIKFSDSRDFICGFCGRYDCDTCNVTKLEKAVDETHRYVATDIDWDCEIPVKRKTEEISRIYWAELEK